MTTVTKLPPVKLRRLKSQWLQERVLRLFGKDRLVEHHRDRDSCESS